MARSDKISCAALLVALCALCVSAGVAYMQFFYDNSELMLSMNDVGASNPISVSFALINSGNRQALVSEGLLRLYVEKEDSVTFANGKACAGLPAVLKAGELKVIKCSAYIPKSSPFDDKFTVEVLIHSMDSRGKSYRKSTDVARVVMDKADSNEESRGLTVTMNPGDLLTDLLENSPKSRFQNKQISLVLEDDPTETLKR